jgi:NAD(P)-dependent dehydrogenase (short-subunit alcohol dehydrogenase family)
MVIASGNLSQETLAGKVAVVTGAGGGIGFEAARALAWLGARVVIAEIDQDAGKNAAERITKEMGAGKASFIQTDVGNEDSVANLAKLLLRTHGKVDIVLNNATVGPLGAVQDVPIQEWDFSYRANLRGPVLLARTFLPGMLKRKHGVFVCVSSVGGAYMAPYETFKSAQIELASAIHAECESAGVIAFTIGPGFVPETPGAQKGVKEMARLLKITAEEFKEISAAAIISVEAAGAGFAAAIALASKFGGREIDSRYALRVAGIEPLEPQQENKGKTCGSEQMEQALSLCSDARKTLAERNEEWKKLGLFQRKWIFRDFSKKAGLPVKEFLEVLGELENGLKTHKTTELSRFKTPIEKLSKYYEHLQELTKGYVKDPKVRKEQLQLQKSWQETAAQLATLVDQA